MGIKNRFSATLPRQAASYRSPVSVLASPRHEGDEAGEADDGLDFEIVVVEPDADETGLTHQVWLETIAVLESQVRTHDLRPVMTPPTPAPLPANRHETELDVDPVKREVLESFSDIELAWASHPSSPRARA